MAIILPRRYTQQPQGAYVVDWSNPITRGLIDVFDLRGIPRSVLLGTSPTFVGVNPVFGSPFVQGRSLDALGGYGAVIFKRTDAAYAPLAQTQVFVGSISSFEAKYSGIIGASWSSGANNSLFLQYYGAAGSYILEAGGTVGGWPATFSMPIGTPFVLSLDGIAGAQHLFINGSIAATATMADASPSGTNSWFHLFSERSGSASYLTMGTAALALQFGRVLSAAEHASVAQNPWQIFKAPPRRIWVAAAATGGAALAAAAADTTLASGALTTAIQMAASATDTASASGVLTTAIKLASAATDLTSATGQLTTAISLAANAADTTSASGLLTTQIALAAAASDLTSATGALTTQIQLAAAATDTTSATGSLNGVGAALSANASDTTSATGALSTAIALGSAASDVTSAAGALLTQILLAAHALDAVTASGSLSTSIPLAGSGFDSTLAGGILSTAIQLSGAAQDLTAATGALSTAIQMASAALDVTSATGDLSLGNLTIEVLLIARAVTNRTLIARAVTNRFIRAR